ncbi:MAG: DEAD/DEAH box helicase, partial [Bacteroidales bacterium]|nr:DEAD/DEAH box helicase [Bacteroidales bacterium]
MDFNLPDLPAASIADDVNRALAERQAVVVTSPTGAGKSTLLPLTILSGAPAKGKILMLEPRRLAARQIAERMAELLGEPVGKTVGYRIRFETRVSDDTRIEVLTEGILSRMLVSDPTLDGIGIVIFDEFHERSLHSDLALALTRRAQQLLRPDLRLLVMSATIDTSAICQALRASLIECQGRMFPIEISYAKEITDRREMSRAAASA